MEPDNDDLIEGLLARRARMTASELAATEALRGDATWSASLATRLTEAAQRAIRPASALATIRLKIVALGARLEAMFQGGDVAAGQVLTPAQVRGDAPGGLLVAHKIGSRAVSTHVDIDGDRFVVMMDLGREAAERGTRVSLLRDGRELASEVPMKGRWLLPRLAPGAYSVRVPEADGSVAELDLVLERSAD